MTDGSKADIKGKQSEVRDEAESDKEDELWSKMVAVKTKTVSKHKADKHMTAKQIKPKVSMKEMHQKEPVKRSCSSGNKTKPNKKRNKKHV